MQTEQVVSGSTTLFIDYSASLPDDHEEDDMAVLVIDNDGMICHCNRVAGLLLNSIPRRITWLNISTILPQLKNVELVKKGTINPDLRFLSRIGHQFDVVAMNDRRFASKLYFNEVEYFGRHCLRLIMRPAHPEPDLR